ncbi:MAG: hypothetical protein NC124_15975 [Clostridium sp.]|nr:hypothetical protein [Clostridium sp.]
MYENVRRTDDRVKVKDTYPLKCPDELQRQRILTDDIRVCVRPTPVMQLKPVQNQTVIQMAPYEDLMNNLSNRADMRGLVARIKTYIMYKNMYEEKRRNVDVERKNELVELLREALNISRVANEINAKLEDKEENKDLKETLRALGKFVHVELSQDETMSLDDLNDILCMVRKTQEHDKGQKIRELGLLAVNDKQGEEPSPHFVLMINGGESADGTGGSVTAPGESTPAFNENWRDVRFIAHTHPNELGLQSDEEFKRDVKGAELDRAEMVRRDDIDDGMGGTVFYTQDGVLNKKSRRGMYLESFAVTESTLNEVVRNETDFRSRMSERVDEYNGFETGFTTKMCEIIERRDAMIDILSWQKLSAKGFLVMEKDLARFAMENPEVFNEKFLKDKFEAELKRYFPKIVKEMKAEKEAERAKKIRAQEDETSEEAGEEFDIGALF